VEHAVTGRATCNNRVMRVLVTGAIGQVGCEVAAVCAAAGDDVVAAGRSELDIADRDAVLGAVTMIRPDVVINAAAWTEVDACEDDPARAFAVNALAVRNVADACARAGAHLVHVSTDYVFSGELDRPYHEWDETSPRSVYGASKLAGEREALILGPSVTVVRTSWVCGAHGANIVKTALRLAAEPGTLRFVDDQIGHPTFAADLAGMLRRLALDRRSGVHHVTNQGAVSWFELVRAVLVAAGHDPARVEPIATADLRPARSAPRPANSVLDNAVLRASGVPLLRDFREPLVELVGVLA
jgi:dTDP-4-dehydrorhamnose reductase